MLLVSSKFCFSMNCDWYNVLYLVFKQKTAYEMLISDWRSDVCSSDLRVLLRLALAALIGITLGALVFHLMAPWTIRLLIGVIALGFTANYWVRRIARN